MRTHTATIRIRYGETDQMGNFYHARALDWFEVGRTEWLRAGGTSYVEMETRGVMLPLTQVYIKYVGKAVYDDELTVAVSAKMDGKASVRFDIELAHADNTKPVAAGYTVHAFVDPAGKPIRPPQWVTELFE